MGVALGRGIRVGVGVLLGDGVGVTVAEGVKVGVGVSVAVGVRVGKRVGVFVGVGVGDDEADDEAVFGPSSSSNKDTPHDPVTHNTSKTKIASGKNSFFNMNFFNCWGTLPMLIGPGNRL